MDIYMCDFQHVALYVLMCVCVCMCVCMYTYMCGYIYVRLHACGTPKVKRPLPGAKSYGVFAKLVYIYKLIYMWVWAFGCVCACLYVCMCMCIYI